jgi:hypothetical protein
MVPLLLLFGSRKISTISIVGCCTPEEVLTYCLKTVHQAFVVSFTLLGFRLQAGFDHISWRG